MNIRVPSLLRRRRRLRGSALVRVSLTAIATIVLVANATGAAVVFAVAMLVVPSATLVDETEARIVNGAMAGAYLLVATAVGLAAGARYVRGLAAWLREERAPTGPEQQRTLRAPLAIFWLQAALWAGAAAVFIVVNLIVWGVDLALRVGLVVVLGGVTTSAIAYLLAERALRPVAIRALATGPPRRAAAPSVAARMVLSWSLGTAVPVLGIVLAGIWALADGEASAHELALTMAVLGTIALAVGLLAMVVTARAVSGPVRAVRDALAEVERGRLDVEVRVDDGSELGRLEAGVNRMVRGLREREALRDLFGRHVGEDVARAALDRGVELGGEVRDVGVLFVDVVGSTALAHEREPHEVVELLNRFFGVVVAVVGEHGGWINKFEGDAALAIFGAPAPLADRDSRVLAAARTIAARLRAEVPELAAGVGASGGEAVAGNVGAPARFEYTVIGDPVNEAARLSELAKGLPGRVVAAARLLEAASPAERAHWRLCGERRLRGRPEPTRVAMPMDAG